MKVIEEYEQFRIVSGVDGLMGLEYCDELIEPCEYNEISRMERYFLCRKAGRIKYIDFNGRPTMIETSRPSDKEEKAANGYIIVCNENQKYGFLSPERVEILPTEYDEIFKWYDCDVVSARKGNKVLYFNTAGEKILTNIRKIDGATDNLYPYYIGEPQTNVVQLMDLTAECEGDDYCECYGVRAGLSRRLHNEHAEYLQSQANVISFKQEEIDSFLADDCYIFASFAVDSESGIIECINRLKGIGCYQSSWFWMYLVLYPSTPTSEEIEQTKWIFKCLGEDISGNSVDGIAFGVSEKVKGIKLIATRYFRDHWPTKEEWNYMTRGDNETLRELKCFYKRCKINRQYNLDRTFRNIIEHNCDDKFEPARWSWKKRRLELCLQLGANMPNDAVNYLIRHYRYCPDRRTVLMKTLIWVIKHGANVNLIYGGETPLDLIEIIKSEGEHKKKDIIAFQRLLLDHGAKYFREIRAEDCTRHGISPAISFA
ncbi:MAG: hypothetical protein NC453_12295 [Muribaculum sp.]|nr:hypothetical protein [Muribaculum sp.]